MNYDTVCECILVLLGGAYVLSRLTGDCRDSNLVSTIKDIVKWILKK